MEADFDSKLFRKNLTRSKNYNKKGFGHKAETLELMSQEFTSMITAKLVDFSVFFKSVFFNESSQMGICVFELLMIEMVFFYEKDLSLCVFV